MSTTYWQSLSKEIAAVSVRIKFTPMTVLTFACRVCVGCRVNGLLGCQRVAGCLDDPQIDLHWDKAEPNTP